MMTVAQQPTTIEDYLALPYTFEVIHNEDGYFARVVELPGCMTWTDEAADLWPMIGDAMRAWIGVSLEHGDPVPVPDASASETVRLRMTEDLHRRLQQHARHDGVTIEQYVTRRLAGRGRRMMGRRRFPSRPSPPQPRAARESRRVPRVERSDRRLSR